MVTGFVGVVMGLTVCLDVTVATEGDRSMCDIPILSWCKTIHQNRK